jgi:cyclomaltodextrinase / maltogenic alpha-amylase / neopullulanase
MFRKFLIYLLLLFLFGCQNNKVDNIQKETDLNWAKGAVWYQIFPERFHNGESKNDPTVDEVPETDNPNWKITPWTSDWYEFQSWEKEISSSFYSVDVVFGRRYGGDLIGVIEKLDYLKELGIDAIYFNPVFEAASSHKYDATSYHHIDDNFGPNPRDDKKRLSESKETGDPSTWIWTKADSTFLYLIKEAHKRNIKIVIDGVFNHSGPDFFAFKDIVENGKNSSYVDWYTIKSWDDPATPEDEFDYDCWWGYKIHPNFREDENGLVTGPREYIFNITKRWMDPNNDGDPSDGIDGWRLDVANEVAPPFWRDWQALVKSINPAAITVAELWEDASEWISDKRMDNTMNYLFAYAVNDFFIDKKTAVSGQIFVKKLEEILKLYGEETAQILWNLIDSHDTDRLASLILNPDRDYDRQNGLRDNPDYNVSKPLKSVKKRQKQILAFQMTFVGAPVIYYGDEAGMWGADDPDDRKPMLWSDFNYDVEKSHPIAGKTRSADENIFDQELFDYYKKMINLKQNNPTLKFGDIKIQNELTQNDVFAFSRFTDSQQVIVIFNRADNSQKITIPKEVFKYSKYSDPMNSKNYSLENAELKVEIADRWFIILISR